MYLTFREMSSAPNVALATPLESFPTLSHPTRAISEASAARPQVRRLLLPKIRRNVQLLLRRPLDSPRQILQRQDRHDSQRLGLLLIQHNSQRLGQRQILQQQDRHDSQRLRRLRHRLHSQRLRRLKIHTLRPLPR